MAHAGCDMHGLEKHKALTQSHRYSSQKQILRTIMGMGGGTKEERIVNFSLPTLNIDLHSTSCSLNYPRGAWCWLNALIFRPSPTHPRRDGAPSLCSQGMLEIHVVIFSLQRRDTCNACRKL